MKFLFSFSFYRLLAICVAVLLSMAYFPASARNDHASNKIRHQYATANSQKAPFEKIRLFKKIRMFMDTKRAMRKHQGNADEKASTMAKVALYLFLGAIALGLLNAAAAVSTAIISTIVSLAFLVSLILALIIVFSDENRKSKAIAKAILVVYGIMILITLVVFAAVIVALSGL